MTKREAELEKENAHLKEQIVLLEKKYTEKIALLEQKIDVLMRRLYEATSEKLTPSPNEDEEPGKPETSSESDVAPEEDAPKDKLRRKRKKGCKKPYPKNLAIIIPDEVAADPDNWEETREDYQDLWDMTPAQYFIRRTINKQYKHKGDKSRPPVQAAMPSPPVAGTRCTPGFAAHLLVSKYCDHLPQYRIEQILKTRYGIDMPRQKLSNHNQNFIDCMRSRKLCPISARLSFTTRHTRSRPVNHSICDIACGSTPAPSGRKSLNRNGVSGPHPESRRIFLEHAKRRI